MDQNPVNPVPVPASVKPIPQAPAAPVVPPTPVGSNNPNVVKSGGGKKKVLIALILIVIILAVGGGAGFYYMNIYSKTPDTSYVAPSPEPTLEPIPTEVDGIESEEELDLMVSEIDSATEDAQMNNEVKSLESDSNF